MELHCAATALFRYCGKVLWLVSTLPVVCGYPQLQAVPPEQQPCYCCSLRAIVLTIIATVTINVMERRERTKTPEKGFSTVAQQTLTDA